MIRPWKTTCNRPAADDLAERWRLEVGARLVTARAIIGCSQKAIATQIGCSPGRIARCESGRGLPDAAMLLGFQKAYGFTVQWLADGSTIGLSPTLIAKIERLSRGLTQRQRES
jgi:ribosome-binding protein aMBF1 (putative translation factor)